MGRVSGPVSVATGEAWLVGVDDVEGKKERLVVVEIDEVET